MEIINTTTNAAEPCKCCGDSGGSGDKTFVELVAKNQIKDLESQISSLKSQLADINEQIKYKEIIPRDDVIKNQAKNIEELKHFLNDANQKAFNLEKQLADIKYLSRDEVEKLIEDNTKIYRDVENKEFDYFHRDKFLDAICKLAIPDIDNEVGEPVTGKPDLCPIETKDIYYSDVKLCGTGGGAGIGYKPKVDREKIIEVLKDIQKTYGKCFDLIEEEELSTIVDEIIKAMEGKWHTSWQEMI